MSRPRKRTTGPTEAARLLGKDRKQLRRWKAQGAPFDSDGKCDVEELRAWVALHGKPAHRPPEIERMAGSLGVPAEPAPAAPQAPAPPVVEAAALDELSAADREALDALIEGDPAVIADLTARGVLTPALLKKLAMAARTRRELAEAERRELENKERRSELHEVAACAELSLRKIHAVRDAFEPLPATLATRLRGVTEWEQTEAVIREALDFVLDGFARG